jgi:hypothetical protein
VLLGTIGRERGRGITVALLLLMLLTLLLLLLLLLLLFCTACCGLCLHSLQQENFVTILYVCM